MKLHKQKFEAPSYEKVLIAWKTEVSTTPHTERITWSGFIDRCGVSHTSFTRLEINDTSRWFLAKIKYGF